MQNAKSKARQAGSLTRTYDLGSLSSPEQGELREAVSSLAKKSRTIERHFECKSSEVNVSATLRKLDELEAEASRVRAVLTAVACAE